MEKTLDDNSQDECLYSVWVGGFEINDYYLTYEKAQRVEAAWKSYGYKDATMRKERVSK